MTHRSRVIALLQATAQCAATFVRAVGRPNNDPLDRELHRCIAEERDVARFTGALGHFRPIECGFAMSGYPPKADIETAIYEYTPLVHCLFFSAKKGSRSICRSGCS